MMREPYPTILADLVNLASRYAGRAAKQQDRLFADLDINGSDFIEFVEETERRFGVSLEWVSPRKGGEASDPTIAALAEDVVRQRS